jgi:hypothetical protein
METLMPPAPKWEDSVKSRFPETRSFSANPTKRPISAAGPVPVI